MLKDLKFKTNEVSNPVITPQMNLERNKLAAATIEARAYGVANSVLSKPIMKAYRAKGFNLEFKPMPSVNGNLYYNLLITDTQVEEGAKNEVARFEVASVKSGETNVDIRVSMFVNMIESHLDKWVINKRLNYWGTEEAEAIQRTNLKDVNIA